MTTLSIFRNALKLNTVEIDYYQVRTVCLKAEAKSYKERGFNDLASDTYKDVRKFKVKLAKAVELQKRIKVEIAAIFRKERIQRKYVKVFGKLPTQQLNTSLEQEAMLDSLLSERFENPCPSIVME